MILIQRVLLGSPKATNNQAVKMGHLGSCLFAHQRQELCICWWGDKF